MRVLAFAIFFLLSGCAGLPAQPRVAAMECIEEIFSNADAYDPGSHFEVNAESAVPNYGAIGWINSNLNRCMRGER